VVFQQWGKWRKVVGQWCFSNGENGERLLNNGVSTMGKMAKSCWTVVFQQWGKWRKVVEQWCFNNGDKCENKLWNSGVSAMGKLGSS
jgi:hypothetical protein